MLWGLVFESPFKRLNIVDGSPVNEEYKQSLQYLGKTDYDALATIMTDSEMNSLYWFWRRKRTTCMDTVNLYKVSVIQHIRNGNALMTHTEVYIFGEFVDVDNKKQYLCPLKRESDYPYDIYESMQRSIFS
jgi:hypothetical protein